MLVIALLGQAGVIEGQVISMTVETKEQGGLHDLIRAHRAHLEILEQQYATMGIAAPPHIVTEIQRYKAEIHDLLKMANMTLADSTIEQLTPTARYQLLYGHIINTDATVWRLEKKLDDLNKKLDNVILALLGQVTLAKDKTVGE